jgi:hypothetical protein
VSAVEVPPEGVLLLRAYFDALARDDWEGAADSFTEDVRYSHPPFTVAGSTETIDGEVRGRTALIELFRRRGSRPFRVDLTHWAVSGSTLFVGGEFEVEGVRGSTVAIAEVESDGRLSFYAPHMRIPVVGAVAGW